MNSPQKIFRLILSSFLILGLTLAINSCQGKDSQGQNSQFPGSRKVRIGVSSENLILEPDIKTLAQKATRKLV